MNSLKDFEDFLKNRLTDENMAQILSAAMAKGNQASIQTAGNDRAEIVGQQILAVSFTISIQLLREYHQWLERGI